MLNDPVNWVDPEGTHQRRADGDGGPPPSPSGSGGGSGGARSSNGGTVYVAPNGTAYQAPPGSRVSVTRNGRGLKIQPPGSQGGANTVRLMDPNPNYTSGYSRVQNSAGQYTDVFGNPVHKSDPAGHICK